MIEQQPVSTTPSEHPALVAYRARNRRLLMLYTGAVIATVVVAFVLVRLAYAHGDINNVDRRTGAAPQAIAPQATAAKLNLTWRTDETAAAGEPVYNGVVVTFSTHTVNGRDARTGTVLWHYTRSDRTLCGVVQQDATTTAVYRHDGNCDQVTGFVTATGEPKFWRTLSENGEISLSSAPNVILIVSKTKVHVIDNAGGLDRWDYELPTDCQTDRALAGSLGVLISFHCGDVHRLAVHDLIQGDKDKTVAKWDVTLNFRSIPILAETTLGVIDLDNGDLVTVSKDKGLVEKDIKFLTTDDPALSRAFPLSETTSSLDFAPKIELVHAGNTVYAVTQKPKQTQPSVLWKAPSDGPAGRLFDDRLAVVRSDKVVIVRPTDGKDAVTLSLTPPPSSTVNADLPRVFALGSGLVLAGQGVEVYG